MRLRGTLLKKKATLRSPSWYSRRDVSGAALTTDMTQHDNETPAPTNKLSWLDLLQSIFAAALGVQSAKNRDRDFNGGSPGVFIAAGLVFAAIFVGSLVLLVQWIVAR
jgi:hypothetical protein